MIFARRVDRSAQFISCVEDFLCKGGISLIKKISSIVLFSIYLIGLPFLQPTVVNGSGNFPITLEVSTDKQSYQADEEVNYEIEVTNHSILDVNDLIISVTVPDEFKVKGPGEIEDDKLILEIDSLAGMVATILATLTQH